MLEFPSAKDALAIIACCPFPLLVLGKHNCVKGYNLAFESLVGASLASQLVNSESPSQATNPASKLLTDESNVCWIDGNNVKRYFAIHRSGISGESLSEARFFIDITRQVELEETHDHLNRELQEQLLTDPVTGLLNKRGLLLALEPQVARSRRYSSPISVIMLDVSSGTDRQQVLIAVARMLKDQLRWADLVACTDQREFVLVLPETTAETALLLAEKLKQTILELGAQTTPGYPSSARYGITACHRNDTATTLLKRAFNALARAGSEHSGQPVAL